MRINGTAVDAAIATLFCAGVVNPMSMGIGGGFIMTVYDRAEGKATTLMAKRRFSPGNQKWRGGVLGGSPGLVMGMSPGGGSVVGAGTLGV